ncbi:hypothetical protein KBI51_09610 [Aerococcaceae bacterium zg-ZUI334]|uniref:hypothetical protein n=1 Tax=Aerococcaceae bacterium zg-252 TaxID=2796928 RepID=UPI001BA303B2|nr:hypothetical protein [Aerococcaceae bacterium zg-ZUI334]
MYLIVEMFIKFEIGEKTMIKKGKQLVKANGVDGLEVAKSAERLLLIYCVCHIISSIGIGYFFAQTPVTNSWRNSTDMELDWVKFIISSLILASPVVTVYTIANLLIQQYANTVSIREALFHYINLQIEKDEKQS